MSDDDLRRLRRLREREGLSFDLDAVADEISRLKAENDRLMSERDKLAGALRLYMGDHYEKWGDFPYSGKGKDCPCTCCQAAREALAGLDPERSER